MFSLPRFVWCGLDFFWGEFHIFKGQIHEITQMAQIYQMKNRKSGDEL